VRAWSAISRRAGHCTRAGAESRRRLRSNRAAAFAHRRRRSPVHGAKRSVESADAPEPGGEGNRGHRRRGLVDQPLRALHAPRHRHRAGRRTRVAQEQAAEVPARHTEGVGKVLHRLAVVEIALLDEPQRARDRRRGATPCCRPGRRFRSTSQARTEATALGGGRGREEDDVARLRRLHGTRRPAVDPCGEDAAEESSVESSVAREPRAIARSRIEHHRSSQDDAL
jgi:hypothetical protein